MIVDAVSKLDLFGGIVLRIVFVMNSAKFPPHIHFLLVFLILKSTSLRPQWFFALKS